MFCGDHSLVGIGTHDLKITPLLCKRWSCPTCFPRRLMQLRSLAAAGEPTTFITLTVNPAHHDSPEAAAAALVKAWRNIRQRAIREGFAERIPFIAIFEETKRGWPHLHILCRAPFIPHAWLSARTEQYLASPIVDIRAIYNRRHASRYVAKYLSKGPADFQGCKRYFRSQDYAHPNDTRHETTREQRQWWLSEIEATALRALYQRNGWHPKDDDDTHEKLAPVHGARWLTRQRGPPPNVNGLRYDYDSGVYFSVAACSARQGSPRSALRRYACASRTLDEPATRCSGFDDAEIAAPSNTR